MTVYINPGSRIPTESHGWTNTHGQAVVHAQEWFQRMLDDGFIDIEFFDTGSEENGRWEFEFQHTVTGAIVKLQQHGINDLQAYEWQCIFTPRVYWNGSSSSEPQISDFARPGFRPVLTWATL